jgi:hypothetical protein
MDIVVLNYPTGEVDVLKNVDPGFVGTFSLMMWKCIWPIRATM